MLRCVPCSHASLRDAIPKALRLPRPRRGLAMTGLVSFMVLWHGFQNEKFEIRRRATPQRAPVGRGFTQAHACTSLAQASFTRALPALHLYSVAKRHRYSNPFWGCYIMRLQGRISYARAYITQPGAEYHCTVSAVRCRSHSARNYARILVHFAGLCHNSGHWARFVSFHAAFFLLN